MPMTVNEVATLLAHLTAIDPHRVAGIAVVSTWTDIFAETDLTFDQAYAGLRACAKTTPAGFIGPNEIIAAASIPTEERARELDLLDRAGPPPIPTELADTPSAEREWIRSWQAEIKAGMPVDTATATADREHRIARAGAPQLAASSEDRVKAIKAFARTLASS